MAVARVVKIGSPYHGDEIGGVDYEQTTDTMYLAHIDHPPTKLVRNSHTSWEFVELTFGPDIAAPTSASGAATVANTDTENDGNAYFPQAAKYVITAVNDDTGQESRASNEVTLTNDLSLKRNYNAVSWFSVAGATRYNVYKAEEQQYFGYIGTTEEQTFTDDNIAPALDTAPPVADNPFTGAGEYPSVVASFEQRLFWARSKNRPNAVFGSRQGTTEYENMDKSRPLRESDSLNLAMTGKQVNAVNQLVSTDQLLALTTNGIFSIDGDGEGGMLTATQRAARRQIGRGASRLEPIVVDNVVFHTPAVGNNVRAIGYNFEFDGIRSNDVSIFSPHLFENMGIVSWCYVEYPHSRIWAAREDGALLCMTWEQEQNVWGWTICETDGAVKWVAALSEDGEDRVYLGVERDVDGETQLLIERMASARPVALADMCFCDSAVSFEVEAPTRTFTNLHHLNGRSDVVGLVDGQAVTGLSVANGALTLPEAIGTVTKATFGIPFTADVQTLPLRWQDKNTGSNVGRKQQTGRIVLDLADTGQVSVGASSTKLYPIKNRSVEAYGAPDNLLTGRVEMNPANVVGDRAECFIRSALPVPLTLLGVYLDPEVGG